MSGDGDQHVKLAGQVTYTYRNNYDRLKHCCVSEQNVPVCGLELQMSVECMHESWACDVLLV